MSKSVSLSKNPYLLNTDSVGLLADPVIQVILENATVVFSNRDRGAYSRRVLIQSVRLSQYPRVCMFVDGDQYETLIRPVIEDPQWTIDGPIFNSLLSDPDLTELRSLITQALSVRFQAAGYGPDSSVGV